MKVKFEFKADTINQDNHTIYFYTKLPFYLLTKFFNSDSAVFKLIYDRAFISNLSIVNNLKDPPNFNIDYNNSQFCKSGNIIPHRPGIGNSEDIIHDSIELNSSLRKAYIATYLSEKLLNEYTQSKEFQDNVEIICKDMGLDAPINFNSQYSIGVYESICKQGLVFFTENKDDIKIEFYKKLLSDLDVFTEKCTEEISDQLLYLLSTLSPMCIRIGIRNISVYSMLLKKEKINYDYDKITDIFEKEFILQFIDYINSITL